MNQGLAYELAQVMPQAYSTGLFVSLCTITQRTNTVDPLSGQMDLSDWVPVSSALTNIPCQVMVQSILKPDPAGVLRLPDEFDTKGYRHVLLNGYFDGQILSNMQANIDGTTYEIMSVEQDSQKAQTRMMVRFYVK